MSYLAALDLAFRVWTSNTWNAVGYLSVYPIYFRQMAQVVLENLTELDLSDAVYTTAERQDNLGANANLPGFLWTYFSPGDILVREIDFPDGWPYPGRPAASEPWIYNEVSIQLITYWTNGYITLTDRDNWDTVLYSEFFEYTFSSTRSRCVREVSE
ncbi:MAG: hypothetical protein LUD68_07370 [Rikenellaceae bacterium]|nr:hypothetical protein [Rikenellaceae bacterium]